VQSFWVVVNVRSKCVGYYCNSFDRLLDWLRSHVEKFTTIHNCLRWWRSYTLWTWERMALHNCRWWSISRPAFQNIYSSRNAKKIRQRIYVRKIPHVYALSLNTRNKHKIHKSQTLFTSTKHTQSQNLYNKRYDKR